MDSGAIKRRTIFISEGDETSVYSCESEMSPELRRKLDRATTGTNAATLLIADKNGREELKRAMQGLPTKLRVRRRIKELPAANRYLHWVEIGVLGTIGLAVWAVFYLK